MARKTVKICGDCQSIIRKPGKANGLCADCSPLNVLHLMLAGDFTTYCGKPMYEVRNDSTHAATSELGSNVNCQRCLDVSRRRKSN